MIVQHGKTYKQPRRVVTCPRAGRAPCFGGGYALYTLVMGTPTQGHQRTFAAACPTPNQHLTCLKSMYDPNRRIALTRFRTSCHDLRIERERYLPKAIQAPMNAPASSVLLLLLKTNPIWLSTAPFMTICALSTQISSPLICPRPSHAFCPKTRIELLHLSMTAMFYAAAIRV